MNPKTSVAKTWVQAGAHTHTHTHNSRVRSRHGQLALTLLKGDSDVGSRVFKSGFEEIPHRQVRTRYRIRNVETMYRVAASASSCEIATGKTPNQIMSTGTSCIVSKAVGLNSNLVQNRVLATDDHIRTPSRTSHVIDSDGHTAFM